MTLILLAVLLILTFPLLRRLPPPQYAVPPVGEWLDVRPFLGFMVWQSPDGRGYTRQARNGAVSRLVSPLAWVQVLEVTGRGPQDTLLLEVCTGEAPYEPPYRVRIPVEQAHRLLKF